MKKGRIMKLKIISIFLFLIVVIGCNLTTPISPGELTNAHANLEGTQNCTQCHILGKWVTDGKCLECHKEIKVLIDNERGYHSSKEVSSKKCLECHNEHHGRDFEIVHFDTINFDHQLTKYILEGKHLESSCKVCHQMNHIEDDSLKTRENTFLGLQHTCITCHDDYHQGSLGKKCEDCHSFNGFDPAEKFDHNNTDYPLIGKHQNVKCEKCHPIEIRNGNDYQIFDNIKYDNCEDCHKDEHDGKFKQACADCHSEYSFKEIKNKTLFNHNLTGYILEGKHKFVDCYNCHKNSCTASLAHNNCYDCHDDYHKGTFTKGNVQKDCKGCHSIQGFNVPFYGIEQHKNSQFPLTGAHIATPCIACHKTTNEWLFRNIGHNCVDCHSNIHKNFISAKYYPQENCEVCHNTDRWTDVNFNHSKTNFILEGAHKIKTCRDCHYKENKGQQIQVFKTIKNTCNSCHIDIHYQQFEINGATNCTRCHNYTNWKIEKFNHDNTKFKLDGKHQNVACTKCHKTITQNNYQFIEYKIKKFQCVDCHY